MGRGGVWVCFVPCNHKSRVRIYLKPLRSDRTSCSPIIDCVCEEGNRKTPHSFHPQVAQKPMNHRRRRRHQRRRKEKLLTSPFLVCLQYMRGIFTLHLYTATDGETNASLLRESIFKTFARRLLCHAEETKELLQLTSRWIVYTSVNKRVYRPTSCPLLK